MEEVTIDGACGMSNEDRIRTALEIADLRGQRGSFSDIWAAMVLAEAYRAQQWQPIETAPRDGTEVLLFDGEWFETGYWETDQWVIDVLGLFKMQPTHWMAIPAAPVTTP